MRPLWLAFPLVAGCFVDAVGSDGSGGAAAGVTGSGSGSTTGPGAGGSTTASGTTSTSAMTGSGPGGMGGSGVGGGPAVGNCIVEAPEACDDCNFVSGDGCSATGAVETGWLCATPGAACLHFSGVTATDGTVIGIGGSGASAFDEACPPGSAVVGFDGDWDGNDLKGLLARCGKLGVSNDGQVVWSSVSETAYYGGTGTALGPIDCPAAQFVVGFDVNYESGGGNQVIGFAMRCATLAFDGQSVVTGAPQPQPHYGGPGGNAGSDACPANQIGTRFTGRHGGRLDKIGLTRASLTPTFCGDSSVAGFETCDDGDAVSGDGCSTVCQME